MRVLIICIFTTLMLSAQAAHGDGMPFNTKNVGKFITSMQEMRTISDKYGAPTGLGDGDIGERIAQAQAPFTSSLENIHDYAGYDELMDVIDDQGFGDVNQWAAFGDRVMRAYGAVKLASEGSEVDAQMAEALKQLENSGLSEAQKNMMREVMGSANQVMDSFKDVPAADRAAITPHLNALENM